MYKLEFTLKQHTPIIHFQHNQDGATLRATEVKPKLDRFIIEKCGGIEKCRKDHNEWFIAEKHDALNYQMKIEEVVPVICKIQERENIGSFFGAMGKEYQSNPRVLSIVDGDINCIMFSKNENLLTELKDVLNKFFALTNFGMRQSKGFGSFSIVLINNKTETFPAAEFDYSFTLSFNSKKIEKEAQKKLAKQIDIFYRSLRSGINIKSFYFKSALFCYLNNKGIQWDKKTIKAYYFNSASNFKGTEEKLNKKKKRRVFQSVVIKYLPSQQAEHSADGIVPDILSNPNAQTNDYQYKLYRDRLGLSNDEKWYSYRQNLSKTEAKNSGISWQKKGKNEDQIVRYKSPIFFKILIDEINKRATVYFDVFEDKSIKDYVGKMFNIQHTPDKINPGLTHSDNLFMPIANNDELDLKDFLKVTFTGMDVPGHINNIPAEKIIDRDGNELDNPEYGMYEDLMCIYEQLKEQLQNK